MSAARSMKRLLWSELLLVAGRRRNQAGLLVLASVPILLAVAVRVATRPRPGHGPDFLSSIAGNGFFVALAALSVEITLFLPLAVAVLSGDTLSLGAALGRLAVAAGYLTLQLAAVAAIGLFVSTLTEQPIAAMVTVTLLVTMMWILDGIPQLDWLHPWLLVDRWAAFGDVMREPVHWATMQSGVLVALGYIVVFLAAAWARFGGKDITS